MKQQTNLEKEFLKELDNINSNNCISIYMPVEQGIYNAHKNLKRLTKALKDCEELLNKGSDDKKTYRELIKNAEEYIEANHQFNPPINTVCLFISENGIIQKTLNAEIPKHNVEVSGNFNLKILEEFYSKEQDFYLLRIDQSSVEFTQYTDAQAKEIKLPEFSEALELIEEVIEHDKGIQNHATATGGTAVMHHGHKDEDTNFQDKLTKFSKKIAEAVNKYLKSENDKLPLVISSTEDIIGLYRKHNNYEQLITWARSSTPKILEMLGS
jgi:tetratricopeptide (TPR) repeat protein